MRLTPVVVVVILAAMVGIRLGVAPVFGFETLFFWQPTVFTKARRSPDETRWAEAEAGYAPLYAATRARLEEFRTRDPSGRRWWSCTSMASSSPARP